MALHALEVDTRKVLKKRRENAGLTPKEPSGEEIDELIKADYTCDDLDAFQKQAVEDLETYTRATHLTYSLEEVIKPQIIEKYLVPLVNGKKFYFIPLGVWQGFLGNILTVAIVIAAVAMVRGYQYVQSIDLVNIVLSFFHWKV